MIIEKMNYIISMAFLASSLYLIISSKSFFKKIIGLALMQNSIILFFISYAKIIGGKVPILTCLEYQSCPENYSNPLPQILMLTAIVVGFVTTSIACGILIKIKKTLNITSEDQITEIQEKI